MILNSRHYSDIIVSLTSFKQRILYVHEALKYILNGDILPQKIILNVFKDDLHFLEESFIYKEFKNYVYFNIADIDYTSHLKYIYAFENFDSPILVIDDDVEYPENFIKMFDEESKKHKDNILALDTTRFDAAFSYKNVIYNWIRHWSGVLYQNPPKEEKLKKYALEFPRKDDELMTLYCLSKNQYKFIIDENRYTRSLKNYGRIENEFISNMQLRNTFNKNSDNITIKMIDTISFDE